MVTQVIVLLLFNSLPWVLLVFTKRLRRYFARILWWAPVKNEEDLKRNETLLMLMGSLMGVTFNAITLCIIVASICR
jgi:hypothetical protein